MFWVQRLVKNKVDVLIYHMYGFIVGTIPREGDWLGPDRVSLKGFPVRIPYRDPL